MAPNEATEQMEIEEYTWINEVSFENEEKCKDFIKKEERWTFVRKLAQNRGYKHIYRCMFCRAHGKPCSASIYVLSDSKPGDTTCKLYRKSLPHDHETSENRTKKVQDSVRQLITDLVEEGKTKKQICHILRRKQDIKQPQPQQVASIIKMHRKVIFGDSKITLEDIVEFCGSHSAIPDDIDTAFVANFEVSAPEESDSESSDESEDSSCPSKAKFRFIITTKRLLLNSLKSNIIHADTTYKMTIQRYPILIVGTTDLDSSQHFHLLGLVVSKTQNAEDFAFSFRSINETIKKISDVPFAPKVLMADAAEAIHNAFRSVYGEDGTILMCYFHVMKKIDDYPLNNKQNRKSIKEDVRSLRLAWNRTIFQKGMDLFLTKWKEIEPAFVEKFENSWVKKNANWFVGAYPNTPGTNNGLESFNGSLKIHQTHWRKEGLAAYKVHALQYISDRSKEYMLDKSPYQSEVAISKSVLKRGEKLVAKKEIKTKANDQNEVHCFITPGDKIDTKEITDADIDQYLSMIPESFDEFKSNMHTYYMVTYNLNETDWKKGTCTCPTFGLQFMCIHITCIAYKLKLLTKEKRHVLEANNKPGRPKNASRALVID